MFSQFPKWMIDDTAAISDARVFVAHLESPRFVGELMADDEADIDGITLAAPFGQTVCRVTWFDKPQIDDTLLQSMAEAIKHHDAVRGVA